MNKPITRRMVETQTMHPGTYNPKLVKCTECKKRFELLSQDWVYKTKKDGKIRWQCSWHCHRAAHKKQYPQPVLRGEKVAQERIDNGKETK